MASAYTSYSENNLSCPICLEVFKTPVLTPCGHSFCETCIKTFWDEQNLYKCPVCNKLFHERPVLQVNSLLLMAAQCRSAAGVKEQHCVKPGEVPCEVCTGTKLKAVKSCLMCQTSYCHAHLEPHQRVAGLKKHQLVDPLDCLEDRMCKKHDRLLELFCHTEQVCVCQFCTETDHKFHRVVPIKQEYEEKMAKLQKIDSEVQQMIHERQQKIQEIRNTVKLSKADADREIADGLKVLTALKRSIEKCQHELNQTVKEKLKSTEKQAEGLIKELEQEIQDLTNRSSEVTKVSHIDDHLYFHQTFKTLINPPHTRVWTTVEIQPPAFVGTLRRSLDQLEETLRMEKKKLQDSPSVALRMEKKKQQDSPSVALRMEKKKQQDSPSVALRMEKKKQQDSPSVALRMEKKKQQDSPSVEPYGVCRQKPVLKTYACELTLDLNTAHRELSLSEDNRKVTRGLEKQSYPDHPERFDSWQQVLCREGLTGSCYWEVERDGYVCIGLTYKGIARRGEGGDSRLGWNNKSWSLACYHDGGYSALYNGRETDIHLPPPHSNRVGVHLDRPAGTLSFYSVSPGVGGSSDTLTRIHTFQSTFNQILYPGFGFGTYSSVYLFQK